MNAAALLTDGSVVTVCELGPGDVSALLALHRGLPVEDQYLRFFSTSPRQLQDFVERMVSLDAPHHVVLGASKGGGVDADVLNDRAAALAPLSTADADGLLHGFRTAGHMLAGANEDAVREVLPRVAELAGARPEIVELDINPLVLTDTGCVVVDARVRVAPAQHTDPFLRTT